MVSSFSFFFSYRQWPGAAAETDDLGSTSGNIGNISAYKSTYNLKRKTKSPGHQKINIKEAI